MDFSTSSVFSSWGMSSFGPSVFLNWSRDFSKSLKSSFTFSCSCINSFFVFFGFIHQVFLPLNVFAKLMSALFKFKIALKLLEQFHRPLQFFFEVNFFVVQFFQYVLNRFWVGVSLQQFFQFFKKFFRFVVEQFFHQLLQLLCFFFEAFVLCFVGFLLLQQFILFLQFLNLLIQVLFLFDQIGQRFFVLPIELAFASDFFFRRFDGVF